MRRKSGCGGALKRCVAVVLMAALTLSPVTALARDGASDAASSTSAASSAALVVESDPAGADVYVDGRLTGHTPLHITSLTSGDHRVRVVKSGYLENGRVVSVGATPKSIRVKLTPHTESNNAALATQVSGGGGGGGSKLPLMIALAGGGAVGAYFLLKKRDHAPTVDAITFTPTTGILATNVTFAAANAKDEDGDSLSFAWEFGDGGTAAGAAPTHVYATAGTFTVKVTVSDGKNSASATGSIVVRSLTSQWTGLLSTSFNTVVNLTQSGTSLTGTYADQVGSGVLSLGSVNVTTRQVTFTVTITSQTGFAPWTFLGTPNAAATTMNGVANGSGFVNSTWTLSRP